MSRASTPPARAIAARASASYIPRVIRRLHLLALESGRLKLSGQQTRRGELRERGGFTTGGWHLHGKMWERDVTQKNQKIRNSEDRDALSRAGTKKGEKYGKEKRMNQNSELRNK